MADSINLQKLILQNRFLEIYSPRNFVLYRTCITISTCNQNTIIFLSPPLSLPFLLISLSFSSLSNLDQDLPNSMIHNVPIKSLPQDWLWCETWCSMETKSTAKTIDLVSWYDTTSTL